MTEKRVNTTATTAHTTSTTAAGEAGQPEWRRDCKKLQDHEVHVDWSLQDGSGAELPIEHGSDQARTLLRKTGECL